MLVAANLASNAAALAEAGILRVAMSCCTPCRCFTFTGCSPPSTPSSRQIKPGVLSKFDAESALKRLPQVTVFMGVPTHYTRLLQLTCLNREVTANVRLFISGSAPLLMESTRNS